MNIKTNNVLILSNNSLSLSHNNGITLNSFFADWPEENIAQLFFNNEIPQSDVCSKFYKLTGIQQFLSRFSKLEKHSAGVELKTKDNINQLPKNPLKEKIISIINEKFGSVKLIIRDYGYKEIARNKKLDRWVTKFNPECIFITVGNNIFLIKYALWLSNVKSIPIITYITDDYILYNIPSDFLGKKYHSHLLNSYKELFGFSKKNFFIGSLMASAFHDKFNVAGEVLINCNLVKPRLPSPRLNEKQKVVNIIYAGGYHYGRDQSILCFYDFMIDVCNELGLKVNLTIYSSHSLSASIRNKFEKRKIMLCGYLPWKDLEKKITNTDFLLHVESFDEKYVKKTMYSISTKIPEYLSSGTCVIAYGSDNLASIRLIMENKIGIVIQADAKVGNNISHLKNAIEHIELRREISRRASIFAETNFSSKVIRTRLYDALS